MPLPNPQTGVLRNIQITAQTAANSTALPANAIIRDITVRNTTANAITGGLKFGTTSGAVDVVAALAVGANALVFVTDALLLKRYFSATAPQQIFYDAVTAWASASVEINIFYYQL
jgi:hypothetical protein